MLQSHPDDRLDLNDFYDGDLTHLCSGLVVSRRGPVMIVRWECGELPSDDFWGSQDKPLDQGDELPCIARGHGKGAVVGDTVHFLWEQSDLGLGLIIAAELRENALVRADALGRRPQTLAANLDRIWVVSALDPPPKSGLIDRYLVAAHANHIPVGLILNKVDLFMDEEHIDELTTFLQPYRNLELPILLLSAIEGDGVGELKEALKGERSVFVGHSGVGKTSLLNALIPGLDEAVNEVSEATGKGQHTTTTSTLYQISEGGELIDSPGIRGFGLWGMPAEELKDHFVEFLEWSAQCYFNNCAHLHEPDCAVLQAVEDGKIDFERYDAYVRIYEDLLDLDDGS
jgi:ribosome biogenesis GTPase